MSENILEKIGKTAKLRVEREKARMPADGLKAMALASRRPHDFIGPLRAGGPRIIAEVKLASPSEGEMGKDLDPVAIAREYAAAGASGISVLTEPDFFRGRLAHLTSVREAVKTPLLMKDFLVDEYQIFQARVFGADCVLLIAALLKERLEEMLESAAAMGLGVLVEVHDEWELEAALGLDAKLVGVNNRDLKSLRVDLEVSRKLARLAKGSGATMVCESGIKNRAQIDELHALGYSAFLVGTALIKSGRPGDALRELLRKRLHG
ncbi:MAG TPA: indole-3-glycerol phosphate synthase TrpC [Elusimicrobiota bacterium]|nr:indole-3-glycerol phosphate synthase TrpC [Elusimicrobiota bacterium]